MNSRKTNFKKNDFFESGHIKKCYDHKNEVLVEINESSPQSFDEGDFLFLYLFGQYIPFAILHTRKRSSNSIIIQFKAKLQKHLAPSLPNTKVYLLKENYSIAENNSFESFSGFLLIDQNNNPVGKIIKVHQYPGHYNFELYIQGKEILVPVNEELMLDINKDSKEIKLQIPEGLIEMFLTDDQPDDLV